MKKLLLAAILLLGSTFGAYSQGYIFVDSEKIFTSQADYNAAIKSLDEMAAAAETRVQETFAQLDEMFNNYQSQRSYLSESNRNAREEEIIRREREINAYRDSMFGEQGELMKKRLELIRPIQDRIFAAITKYAQSNNYTMVIDRANNITLLYYLPSLDKTEDIINALK